MQSGHINGVPCLQCIDSILREEYSDNGDLVAYVVDVSAKVSVLRSGELRSYLQLSLIDESSIDRPLVHQIWGDIVRKLQRIVVKGCIVCIYNYSRVRVYGGALMIRDGTIEVVELFNSCPINTEIFPLVVRRRVSNILLWLGGTIYRSCIRLRNYQCPWMSAIFL